MRAGGRTVGQPTNDAPQVDSEGGNQKAPLARGRQVSQRIDIIAGGPCHPPWRGESRLKSNPYLYSPPYAGFSYGLNAYYYAFRALASHACKRRRDYG